MNSGRTLVHDTRCLEDIGSSLARTAEAKTAFVYFVSFVVSNPGFPKPSLVGRGESVNY